MRQVLFAKQVSQSLTFPWKQGLPVSPWRSFHSPHPFPSPVKGISEKGGHDITSFRPVRVTHAGQTLVTYPGGSGAVTSEGHALKVTLLSSLAHFPRRVSQVWSKWLALGDPQVCSWFPLAPSEAVGAERGRGKRRGSTRWQYKTLFVSAGERWGQKETRLATAVTCVGARAQAQWKE